MVQQRASALMWGPILQNSHTDHSQPAVCSFSTLILAREKLNIRIRLHKLKRFQQNATAPIIKAAFIHLHEWKLYHWQSLHALYVETPSVVSDVSLTSGTDDPAHTWYHGTIQYNTTYIVLFWLPIVFMFCLLWNCAKRPSSVLRLASRKQLNNKFWWSICYNTDEKTRLKLIAHPKTCNDRRGQGSGGWPAASCRPVGWSRWWKGPCRQHPFISRWAKSLWCEIQAYHCPSVQLSTTHILSFISQTAICSHIPGFSPSVFSYLTKPYIFEASLRRCFKLTECRSYVSCLEWSNRHFGMDHKINVPKTKLPPICEVMLLQGLLHNANIISSWILTDGYIWLFLVKLSNYLHYRFFNPSSWNTETERGNERKWKRDRIKNSRGLSLALFRQCSRAEHWRHRWGKRQGLPVVNTAES